MAKMALPEEGAVLPMEARLGEGVKMSVTLLESGRKEVLRQITYTDFNGWVALAKEAEKSAWIIRAACLKAAKDSKEKYHSDAVAVMAEALGMNVVHARKTIQDYELMLAGGGYDNTSYRMESVPQSIVREARENAPTPEAAITTIADYRDRKEAGAAPSVRQFAAELKAKKLPAANDLKNLSVVAAVQGYQDLLPQNPITTWLPDPSEEPSTTEEEDRAAYQAKIAAQPNVNQFAHDLMDVERVTEKYSPQEVFAARRQTTKAMRRDNLRRMRNLAAWFAEYAEALGNAPL